MNLIQTKTVLGAAAFAVTKFYFHRDWKLAALVGVAMVALVGVVEDNKAS